MAGQIAPKNLYDVRPDLRAMGVLLRLKEKNAHTIFGAIADELKKDGVELIEATPWLEPLMPGPGFRLGPAGSPRRSRRMWQFGFRIAKEVSRLEIGQTVVVKEGTVLAVEGFEGTDKCLARGGELAGQRRRRGGGQGGQGEPRHAVRHPVRRARRRWKPAPRRGFRRAGLRGRAVAAAGTRGLRTAGQQK